jgi:hypothetical protein
MKTILHSAAITIALCLLGTLQALAFFDPHIGRWASRDPLGGGQRQNARAGNVYSFCGNDAIACWDQLGLWSDVFGNHEHRDITHSAFEPVWKEIDTASKGNCQSSRLLGNIVLGNVGTDDPLSADGNDNTQHYLRAKDENVNIARGKYSKDLSMDEYAYFKLLESNPGKQECVKALRRLGHIAHMWQDYYAHAIRPDSPFRGDPGLIAGDPSSPSLNLKPASWGGLTDRYDEHGSQEPARREQDGGVNRYNQALRFTANEFPRFLSEWLHKCKCHCSGSWPGVPSDDYPPPML